MRTQGEGVKKRSNFAGVLYGRPLTKTAHFMLRLYDFILAKLEKGRSSLILVKL